MTGQAAATEYLRLSTIAADTEWGSNEWKAAILFAHEFEDTATEAEFDAYLDALARG